MRWGACSLLHLGPTGEAHPWSARPPVHDPGPRRQVLPLTNDHDYVSERRGDGEEAHPHRKDRPQERERHPRPQQPAPSSVIHPRPTIGSVGRGNLWLGMDQRAEDMVARGIWADRSSARWCTGLAGLGCIVSAVGAGWTSQRPVEFLSASAIAAVLAFVALRCADRSRRPVLEFGGDGLSLRRRPLPTRVTPWDQVRYVALSISRGRSGVGTRNLVVQTMGRPNQLLTAPLVIEPVLGLGPPASFQALGLRAEAEGADVAWRPTRHGRYALGGMGSHPDGTVARRSLHRRVAVFTAVCWLGFAASLTVAGTALTPDRVALVLAVGLGLSVAAYPRGRWDLVDGRLVGPRGGALDLRPRIEVHTSLDSDGNGMVHLRNGAEAVVIPMAWLPRRLERFLNDLGLERIS